MADASKPQVKRGRPWDNPKTTPETRREMRELWRMGADIPNIAKRYGLSYHTVWKVLNGVYKGDR